MGGSTQRGAKKVQRPSRAHPPLRMSPHTPERLKSRTGQGDAATRSELRMELIEERLPEDGEDAPAPKLRPPQAGVPAPGSGARAADGAAEGQQREVRVTFSEHGPLGIMLFAPGLSDDAKSQRGRPHFLFFLGGLNGKRVCCCHGLIGLV